MPRDKRSKSARTESPDEDVLRIDGVGPVIAERLHNAGIRTCEDLVARTAAEIADVAGVSTEHIASQDWIGQARRLAGSSRQHSASFNIELVLEQDKVHHTNVHHHQSNTDDTWSGWDEGRLLTFLRDRVPLMAGSEPIVSAGLERPAALPAGPAPSLPAGPEQTTALPASPLLTAAPALSLSPACLHVEDLIPMGDGESSYIRSPEEPTSIRLTLRVDSEEEFPATSVDFKADIAARLLGGHQRVPIGAVEGAIDVNETHPVELIGGPRLPPGLYRLVVNVALYPAGHLSEAPPFFTSGASGHLVQVTEAVSGPRRPRAQILEPADVRT